MEHERVRKERQMITIYKYPIPSLAEWQSVHLPKDARILTIQPQGDILTIWALVDTEAEYENIGILILGTGFPIPKEYKIETQRYFTTVQMGKYVWHIFLT